MIDTKVFVIEFVSFNFVKHYKLLMIILSKSMKLRLANNETTHQITRMTQIKIQLKNHLEKFWCMIALIDKFDVILNMFWLKQHDVHIRCKSWFLLFDSKYCLINCLINNRLFVIYNCERKSKNSIAFATSTSSNISILKELNSFDVLKNSNKHMKSQVYIVEIFVFAFMKMTFNDKNQIIIMWSKHFQMLKQFEKNDKYLLLNVFIIDIVVINVQNYEKFFNKIKKTFITIDQLKQKVFKKSHKYINNWNLTKINKVLSHKNWNHRIDFRLEAKLSIKKAYELFKDQISIIKKYVNDMLKKNFIRSSVSNYASLVLIIKKFENNLRICMNYKVLNAFTIKNRNVSSLIKEILTRLCVVKIYNKFDIIVVFNEISIKKKDEKKTTFLTRYELFEYVIMSFELCNAYEIFQFFINVTLREYLNDFCTTYLNDILIYNNNREEHVKYVNKVFERLKKTNLFLNIDKCDFFVIEMKYLRLIIITKEINMNSIKVNIIINWKTSRNLKNVQTFFDFANFYRKFILNYFKLIVFLIKLIKILKKDFIFSWDLDDSKKKTFQILKIAFITISILIHFDLDKKIWIESDASNYVIIAMMSQMIDEVLRFVIFMFKKMFLVECNYEIYDKELLAIIKVFEKWRLKCARTFVKNSMKIFTNHKNLKHFMTLKQFNRRQTRWAKFLSMFNFRIIYRFEIQSIKLDNLTKRFKRKFKECQKRTYSIQSSNIVEN